MRPPYYVHPSAYVDEPCTIGAGTQIWHFCHVMAGAQIGERCILGQNVHVAPDVVIGNNVKLQNNVSVYTGWNSKTMSSVGRRVSLRTSSTPGRRSCVAISMRVPWCAAGRRSGPMPPLCVGRRLGGMPLWGGGGGAGGRAGLCAHAGGAGGAERLDESLWASLGAPMRTASGRVRKAGGATRKWPQASCAVSTGQKTSLCRKMQTTFAYSDGARAGAPQRPPRWPTAFTCCRTSIRNPATCPLLR